MQVAYIALRVKGIGVAIRFFVRFCFVFCRIFFSGWFYVSTDSIFPGKVFHSLEEFMPL